MHILIKNLIGAVLLATCTLLAADQSQKDSAEPLIHVLNVKVLDTIAHAKEIPGLKAEEFDLLKEAISQTWSTLVQNGVIEMSGADKEIRPYFVALQGIIEHVLSHELQQHVKDLQGMIHTPMPATPLCTMGEISKDLVDPTIESDPKRVFTVKARTTIIRDFLQKGGVLYVIYPKNGLAKRTEIQQSIYQQELCNYPEHLKDRPLNCASLPDELIGATYLFTGPQGLSFAFAIKMTQANDPKENATFGLWLGSLDHPEVKKRVNAVMHFIERDQD